MKSKLLMAVFIFLASSLFSFSATIERVQTGEQVYDSGCRIFNNTTAGSGAVVHQLENGDVIIATNYHVAQANDCDVQFFANGICQKVRGKNIWRAYDQQKSIDIALLQVSVNDVPDNVKMLPIWNSDKPIANGETLFITAGAPRAQWLKELKGTIKLDGDNNVVFKPTPFGGQSGSGIAVQAENGLWYWAGIITWRTADENTEDYGGLAQTSAKIMRAIRGEVADVSDDPLPETAVAVPCRVMGMECHGDILEIDGKPAIECAASTLEAYELQQWCIAGCDPCTKARTYWNPVFKQMGIKVTVHHGDGNERFVADSLGIASYPTYVLFCDGVEVKRWTGYFAENKVDIENKIKKIKQDILDQQVKDLGATECEDETCKLFPRTQPQQSQPSTNGGSNVGRLDLFSLPKSDEENSPKSEKNENSPNIHKENQPEKPKNENQPLLRPFQNLKPEKNEDESNGGLFNWKGKLDDELQKQKDKLQNELDKKIKGLAMTTFWLMFLACTLALFCYKFTSQILKCFWWGIKWCFKKINECISNIFNSSLEKVVEKVKETTTTVVTKTTSKKE